MSTEITPALLAAMFNAYDLSYQQGLAAVTDQWWQKVAMKRPSSTSQNTYAWFAKVAQMTKWVDERTVHSISSYGYALVNDDYDLTVEVDRNKIEDDQFGLYSPLMENLGYAAGEWPNTGIAAVMTNGHTNLCYDGQNFFDTAHPVNKYKASLGTQSNYFTTRALTPTNAMYVRRQMLQYKGEDGLPLRLKPKLLIVGPELEEIGLQICAANFLGTGTVAGATQVGSNDNFYKGLFELLVIPEITEAGAWYLADMSRPVKPFVFQTRADPKFVQLTNATDENVWRRKKFIYAADARGAFGYGLWPLCAKALA